MKFSIIIPVYNVAPYLRECLDSVLSQTYDDWECICVDDGSTDESGEILEEYALKVNSLSGYGKFKVIHQTNAGVAVARNRALDVATGEMIIFVDADDCVASDLLGSCNKATDSLTSSLVLFGREAFESSPRWGEKCLSDGRSFDVDISRQIPYSVAEADFWQFAYPGSLLCNIRFPKYVMGEDRLFLAWVLVRAKGIKYLDGVGYFYRRRQGSAVNSKFSWTKFHDDICHSVRRMLAFVFCRKHVGWRVYRHQLGLWLNMIRRLV